MSNWNDSYTRNVPADIRPMFGNISYSHPALSDRELMEQAFLIADDKTMALGSTAHVLVLVREIRRLQKLLADREQLRPPEDREPGLEDVRF